MKTDKQTKVLDTLKIDLEAAKASHSKMSALVTTWVREYEGILSPTGAQATGRGANMTNTMTMTDSKKAVESSLPSLTEPFISQHDIVDIQPKDAESSQKAVVMNKLINYQFSKLPNTIELVENVAKTVQVEGISFVKVGWSADSPSLETVAFENLLLDPSAKRMSDLKFAVEVRKVSISDILANPSWYGKHTLESLKALTPASSGEYEDTNADEYGRDSSFNFDDRSRQLIEIYEYYGMYDLHNNGTLVPIIGIWCEDKLLKLSESPFPTSWNGIPFESCVYTRKTNSIYGGSISELIGDLQKVRSYLMRGVLGNIDKGYQGQRGVRLGSMNPLQFRKFASGLDYEYNGDLNIVESTFNETPQSIFQLMESLKTEQEEMSGVGRLNGGLDPRALNSGTSATAANIVNTNSEKRLLQITRHISEMLERVFRKWIDLNIMLLENGSVRMGDRFLQVEGSMLEGSYDLEIVAGTSGAKQSRIQNLQMMMGLMTSSGQQIPPSMLSQMANLLDMPALAEELENQQNQPQEPSELEQIGVQLELEEKQSVIAKNNASAELDGAKSMETFVNAQNASYGLN